MSVALPAGLESGEKGAERECHLPTSSMSAPSEAAGQWQWVLVREASSNTKAASIKLSTEQIFLVRENERTFHSSLPHVEKQVSVRVDRNGRVLLQQVRATLVSGACTLRFYDGSPSVYATLVTC